MLFFEALFFVVVVGFGSLGISRVLKSAVGWLVVIDLDFLDRCCVHHQWRPLQKKRTRTRTMKKTTTTTTITTAIVTGKSTTTTIPVKD